ncbi:hypothetical protein RMR10_010280 [Agrobacterium rosae]|uniref:hypothetical protein n=1 Tax=Agrobacterium rosae TaxID=1972867 RepID=UPI002A0F0661|nr:hypothetical protein [Agrobacterium rosae]MDX8313010.1 hypothetical protein [Agrobacterium rosae]
MKRKILSAICAMFLTSCYSVPATTDFVLKIDRDYKEVADCAWQTFRAKESWGRDNLDSMNKVEFALRNTTSTAGRIDIIGISPGKTEVRSFMPNAVWGKDFWPSKLRPIFEACSRA